MGGQDNLSSSFLGPNNKVSKGDGPGQNVVPWQEVFYDSEVFYNHATPKTWYPHSPQEYHTAICGQHQVLGYFGQVLRMVFGLQGVMVRVGTSSFEISIYEQPGGDSRMSRKTFTAL